MAFVNHRWTHHWNHHPIRIAIEITICVSKNVVTLRPEPSGRRSLWPTVRHATCEKTCRVCRADTVGSWHQQVRQVPNRYQNWQTPGWIHVNISWLLFGPLSIVILNDINCHGWLRDSKLGTWCHDHSCWVSLLTCSQVTILKPSGSNDVHKNTIIIYPSYQIVPTDGHKSATSCEPVQSRVHWYEIPGAFEVPHGQMKHHKELQLQPIATKVNIASHSEQLRWTCIN